MVFGAVWKRKEDATRVRVQLRASCLHAPQPPKGDEHLFRGMTESIVIEVSLLLVVAFQGLQRPSAAVLRHFLFLLSLLIWTPASARFASASPAAAEAGAPPSSLSSCTLAGFSCSPRDAKRLPSPQRADTAHVLPRAHRRHTEASD